MFKLYDKVIIKDKQIEGTIVDIYNSTETIYTVESNKKERNEEGYGGDFLLFDCKKNEIEKVF